jgi:Uncharacterized protein conserved in bacteria (DUF2330)
MHKYFHLFALIILLTSRIYGDRGGIPVIPDVTIYEPNQKAIIGWNGIDEILVLSTDMKAERKTNLVEIMPFPSRPSIYEGDTLIFKKFENYLVETRKNQLNDRSRLQSKGGLGENQPISFVQFLSHQLLGQHSISVLKITSARNLEVAINHSLKSFSIDTISIPTKLVTIVKSYIAEGYNYFAIDAIQLDTSNVTQKPIYYKFPSNRIYYPLKISSLSKGSTNIDIITINTNCWLQEDGPKCYNVSKLFEIGINKSTIMSLDSSIGRLVENACSPEIFLNYWSIKGNYSEFTKDVILKGRRMYGSKIIGKANRFTPIYQEIIYDCDKCQDGDTIKEQ